MTLLTDWDGIDPTGWFISEKYWDVRVMWDGSQFWTRAGNIVTAPDWFTAGLPHDQHLDGGIYAGRAGFNAASAAVRFGAFDQRHSFLIYDRADIEGTWPERLASVCHRCATAEVIPWEVCRDRTHLIETMQAIQGAGGEGCVIRSPDSHRYAIGRSRRVLKVKTVPPVFDVLRLMKRRDAYYGPARRAHNWVSTCSPMKHA